MVSIFCTIAHCAVFDKAEILAVCFMFPENFPKNLYINFTFTPEFGFFLTFSKFCSTAKFFSIFFTVEKHRFPSVYGRLQVPSAAA